jgi:FkbM family methyltransferase
MSQPTTNARLSALRTLAARRINLALNRLGYRVSRTTPAETAMESGLRRAAARGTRLETIIDVGASNGSWSEIAHKFFSGAKYLLIEANAVHEDGLRAFKGRVPNADYVLAAAGDRVGTLHFDGRDPMGGLASTTPGEGMVTVRSTTIDHEVATRGLPPPYAIKLDTHGFEVPILEASRATLAQTNLLVIEVYNFTLLPGALRFQEMCNYLAPLGFSPIDLCDPMYRPKDGAFWQCDLFFARSDRPEFADNNYA